MVNPVDIAIVTIIEDEYMAILDVLENTKRDHGSRDFPNTFAWRYGYIPAMGQQGQYRIVVALAGKPGQSSGSMAVIQTARRWQPRHILLVGIAGGLPLENLAKGDVVISTVIWDYEYGKAESVFLPRHDFTYQVDGSLVRNAVACSLTSDWRKKLASSPDGYLLPKVIPGPIASGNKVVDEITDEFFGQVQKAWPKLQAIEMEGAGAAAAVQTIQEDGKSLGFLMIRGISDMPSYGYNHSNKSNQNSETRHLWKKYAATVAAHFTTSLISTNWPYPPQQSSLTKVKDRKNISSRQSTTSLKIKQPSTPFYSKKSQQAILVATFDGHADEITSISVDPISQVFASSSKDHTVRYWSLNKGFLKAFEYPGPVNCVKYSKDGTCVAVGYLDEVSIHWMQKEEQVGHQFEHHSVRTVDFSYDKKLIVTGGGSIEGTIRLWHFSDKILKQSIYNRSIVYSTVFSPNDQTVASASGDQTVRLWRVKDGKLLRTINHDAMITGVVFVSNGNSLITGSTDGKIRRWRVIDGMLVWILEGRNNSVHDIAIAPDEKIGASAEIEQSTNLVKLWQIDNGSLIMVSEQKTAVNTIAFSADGRILVTGGKDGTIRLWNIA